MKSLRKFFETYGWCKHSLARDKNNLRVLWRDPAAVSFCFAGGLMRCTEMDNDHDAKVEYQHVLKLTETIIQNRFRHSGVAVWNDQKATHEDILKLASEVDQCMGITEERKLKEIKE